LDNKVFDMADMFINTTTSTHRIHDTTQTVVTSVDTIYTCIS